ncbi:MAG: hypothetical protein HOJ51_15570 [Tateyamaria sp.]|jgi:hypothetical protein|nr:hypothetical protein [Tateyamaria sp.]MBT6344820.1 hypothetical protein [Tateyamaria sp.]
MGAFEVFKTLAPRLYSSCGVGEKQTLERSMILILRGLPPNGLTDAF